MQEEVESRTVTLAVNATKMTANVLKQAISKYLAHCKEKKAEKAREGPVKPCGKQSLSICGSCTVRRRIYMSLRRLRLK